MNQQPTHCHDLLDAARDHLDTLLERMEQERVARMAKLSNRGVRVPKMSWSRERSRTLKRIKPFIQWAQRLHGITDLEQLQARAEELASAYLRHRVEQHCQTRTFYSNQIALRLFFSNHQLAKGVEPPRLRSATGLRDDHW